LGSKFIAILILRMVFCLWIFVLDYTLHIKSRVGTGFTILRT
jgi:hypothetical protein